LDVSAGWEWADTQAAHRAWNRYIELRCARKAARRSFGKLRTAPSELEGRPVADVLIGAFAANRSGLLTRNPSDFSAVYPSLRILTPAG
jgi:predicted nucleic acid-binding protein